MPAIYSGTKVKTRFPRPRHHIVRDTDKTKNAVHFFEYWAAIPADVSDFIEVNVYRLWPACDLRLVEPGRKSIAIEQIEGKIPFDAKEYKQFFLDKFGSGEWKVFLNERGLTGEVMQGYFSAIDMESYPPKLDLRTLMRGAFANKEYIRGLQQKNIELPWTIEGDPIEEGEDMQIQNTAAADALKTVVDQNTRMADKIIESAEKAADARVEGARNQGPSAGETAVNESIKLVTGTAESMIKMVTENSGKQYDPVEMLKATADIMHDRRGGGEDHIQTKMILDAFDKSLTAVAASQKETVDFMKTVVMQKNQDGAFSKREAEPVKSFAEQLREFKELSELLGMGQSRALAPAGEGPEPRQKESSSWLTPETVPLITGFATTILVLVANGIHNWAEGKKGTEGKPIAPTDALKGATGGGPTAAQQPQQQPGDPRAQWAQFIENFKGPFLSHFFDAESSGYTLAAFIQSNGTGGAPNAEGRHTYMLLKERLELKGLDMLIRGNHDIWSKVQGIPQQYQKFLQEFFTYDEYLKEQNAEEEEEPVEA